MSFAVLIAEDAERDLEDIYRYIAGTDALESAERVLTALEASHERGDEGSRP